MAKDLVLPRPNSRIQGQVFLAGGQPSFEGAKLTVTVADTTVQDAPAKVLAESTYDLPQRPVSNWAPFEMEIDWQAISARVKKEATDARFTAISDHYNLADMSISAKITTADGKLLFISTNRHPLSMAGDGAHNWWYVRHTVVVVEAA